MTGPPNAAGAPDHPPEPHADTHPTARQDHRKDATTKSPTVRFGGPLRPLTGPPIRSEGGKAWLSRADVEAAHLAVRQIEEDLLLGTLKGTGHSRHSLAAALGVTEAAIEHWRAGRRSPHLVTLIRLGRVLTALTRANVQRDTASRRGPLRWEDVDQ